MKRVVADRPISFDRSQMMDPKGIDLRGMVKKANEEEAAEKAAAELEKKRQNFKAEHAELFKQIEETTELQDKFNLLFEEFVPGEGEADTVGGEILRAVARIKYRWWNDGDMFMVGYGIETAGPSAAYLLNSGTPLAKVIDKIGDTMHDKLEATGTYDMKPAEDEYDAQCDELVRQCVNYLTKDTEKFIEPNEDSSRGDDYSDIEQYIPYFECDWDLDQCCPAVAYHMEQGNLSSRDVIWEIDSWEMVKNEYGDEQPDIDISYGNTLYISNLELSAYQELEGRSGLMRALESYNEEVINEYGDPEELEAEDEDEYEEEEEDAE